MPAFAAPNRYALLKRDNAVSESDDINWLKAQVVDLQSQLAFQEDTIQALNDVVTGQQQQLERLHERYRQQQIHLEHINHTLAKGADEDRPPHY